MRPTAALAMVTGLIVASAPVSAQTPGPSGGEPLRLATLQREALAADPRAREFALQTTQSDLRVRNIEVERLPTISGAAQTQYQSDVPTAPVTLPNGQPLFSAPKDTYDASIRVDQRIFDPTAEPRLALARADLADAQARLRTTLFALRQEVNDAFFTAALLQEQIGALAATVTGLEGRLQETTTRVREGTALAAEAAAVEATLLQDRLQVDELRAVRGAALARLETLTGRPLDADARLELPDLVEPVARARSSLASLRARPEYEAFARARDRAASQQSVAAAAERPQVSAFGRIGYAKPGLNFIADRFETYGVAGLQVQWKAWTWGSAGREREALAIQQSMIAADEAAFSDGIRRAIEPDLATIDRLQDAVATDDRIVGLRQEVEQSAGLRFREGVVTSSEYLDRDTESLHARFDRARHRVELAQARARLLTTLGLEVQ